MLLEEQQVAIGCKYSRGFLAEATRAILGHVSQREKPSSLNPDAVKSYFEERSKIAPSESSDIVAMGSLPYEALMKAPRIRSFFMNLTADDCLLDYGCGSAQLRQKLRSDGFQGRYIGIDINTVAINQLNHENSDKKAIYSCSIKDIEQISSAVICNVLVYNGDQYAKRILSEMSCKVRNNGLLLVMEPFPRWYWELCFDGLRLRARDPLQLITMLAQTGWSAHSLVKASFASILGCPCGQIAYGIVAKKMDMKDTKTV